MKLLADKLVELGYVERISDETVRRVMKKNQLQPWRTERFCIPPEKNAAFVAAMEDVLEVSHRPYDPKRPQVCMDETSKQLVSHVRAPIAAAPGRRTRHDDECVRQGVANVFCAVEPLTGQVVIEATERRTGCDWAHFVRSIVQQLYPEADRIVMVVDNLSTHSTAALYEAFPAPEARRLAEKLELHFTPKHSSWLNMAEIDLSILNSQCLNQREQDLPAAERLLRTWQQERNAGEHPIQCRFTTDDARIKLRRLYPST